MSLLGLTQGKNVMQQIYEALNEERCILVLGPNLASMQTDAGDVPIHTQSSIELSKYLAQSGISFDPTKSDQLDYIALRCVKSNLPQIGHSQLLGLLQHAYSKQAHQIPNIYLELAKIPFHFILNASSDNYLYQAIGTDKAQLRYLNYHRNDLSSINSRKPIGDFSSDSPLIYNLFGLFEDKESLVISKLDQLEFINKLFNRTIEIPNSILNQFRSDSVYLFLGFDAKSWHLPILFRILGFHEHRAAFFYEEEAIEKALEDLYTDIFKFQFRNDSMLDFIKNLGEGYEAWENNQPIQDEQEEMAYVSSPLNGLSQSNSAQVLMMTANPKNTQALNLNKEINQIGEELERSKYRDRFRIEKELDVTKGNISFILRKNAPQVLHFSGHGTGKGLLFYGENEFSDQVSGEKLGKIIRNHYSISCVFLNACYSEEQATAIAQFVPNVIGTTKAISDKQATSFAAYFYRHIFAGLNYEDAYRQALDDLSLDNFKAEDFVFFKQGQLLIIS
jgi:hypothetical protein